MSKRTLVLGLITLLLGIISVLSWHGSVTRAERFERGQKFLSQLNPDNISRISIDDKGETTTLVREGDRFTVAEQHDYPTKNEAVNRFITDILNISLEKEVGSGESLAKELAVAEPGPETTQITLFDDGGNTMVRFLIGKTGEAGSGNYIRRLNSEDQTIYLTDRSLSLSTDADSFLDKEILDIPPSQITSVTTPNFQIQSEEGNLALAEIPKDKAADTNALNQVTSALQNFRYDRVYLADDQQVADLNFDKRVIYELKDQSSYNLSLAERDGKLYAKVRAVFEPQQIMIARDESEEELKEKSEILSRNDEVVSFNEFHGSWVYELPGNLAETLLKKKSDILKEKDPEKEKS